MNQSLTHQHCQVYNYLFIDFKQISADDKFFYCGTTTGDILAVNMVTNTFQVIGPEKEKFSLGVTSLIQLPSGEFLVGAGDGTVAVVGGADTRFKRSQYAEPFYLFYSVVSQYEARAGLATI